MGRPRGGAGGGQSISGAGTLTINSVANTVDAHIIGSPDVQAFGDVAVNSSEAASAYVAALTGAGSTTGSGIGASIAYNYIGGLAPLDPNVITYQDGIIPGTTHAQRDGGQPDRLRYHDLLQQPDHSEHGR